ncbi:MAG: dTDP-glucose pyrophosphorylase [Candidatus Lokiarchaeota archaeon]|nr:dTDP-glucose pyrophosphorylase [Candidatus Lokiarchaeota archaeon]
MHIVSILKKFHTHNYLFNSQKIIGLIPAAGCAKRLSPIPVSKEILPIGFYKTKSGSFLPKPACLYLLDKMQRAHITNAIFILRDGKWDIPECLCRQKALNMNFSYLVTEKTDGVPYTLDIAYPFINNAIVAFGFPDIIFNTEKAFVQLIDRINESRADVTLGLFPTNEPHKKDMVQIDHSGFVKKIFKNPGSTDLKYTWCIAIWKPSFTRFMHHMLNGQISSNEILDKTYKSELTIGDVLQAAINSGLKIHNACFNKDFCLDIGTPTDLDKAMKLFDERF